MRSLLYILFQVCANIVVWMRAHPFTTGTEPAFLAEFESLVTRGTALEKAQRAARTVSGKATKDRTALRGAIYTAMTHLVAVARGAYRRESALEPFKLPLRNVRHQTLTSVATSMREAALADLELFNQNGLEPGVLDALEADVKAYAEAVTTGATARSDRRAATKELDVIQARLMDLLHQMDGVNRFRFKDQPEILAAWQSARNLPWRHPKVKDEPPAGPADGQAA